MATTGVNKVILLGNLGKDPEVKHFEGGTVRASFTLATSEVYKDKNGNRVEQTEWHNIVLWRAQAEFAAKYLKKGFTIFVEGKLRTRSWDDATQGKKYITEIAADNITIISHNEKREGAAGTAQVAEPEIPVAPGSDDLPF
jgi:single-strand DNA-binding protein